MREKLRGPVISRDQGPNCGAGLAADQRYCVECGERVGDSRVPAPTAAATPPTVASAPRRIRMSPNSSLIAGVGVLLLALGVGVLIGRAGNNASAKNTPQVVTVQGAGSAAATPTTTSAATTTTMAATTRHKKSAKKAAAANQGNAAARNLNAKVKLPPAKVKVGQKGAGPGFDKKTHKFTGNFFGGG
jgi:hypothetical protein